jgi:hypothetical protein
MLHALIDDVAALVSAGLFTACAFIWVGIAAGL